MAYDIEQLLRMTQPQLDELFTASPPGDIPDGEGKGTAIIAAGTGISPEIAAFINHFAWQGKIFDAKAGLLKNKICPSASPPSLPASTRARAGSIARNASCSTIRKPRWWPDGYATRSE